MDFQGRYVEVRGTRLYVYEIGDAGAPALLYLHGGPGMGSHEFVYWQGRRLGVGLRLVAFDQRGSHHSDPVAADEQLGEDVLVEDCEALREALGVQSWFVLGHSSGGRIAVRYAARYPGSVRGVIFENPSWNAESTHRFRMPALAAIYDSYGCPEQAQACRDFAARPDLFADALRAKLMGGIEELGQAWYLHDRSSTSLLDGAGLEPPLFPEADARAAERLNVSPQAAEDLRPLLAELTMAARLIVGEADLVTSPDQIEYFAAVFGSDSIVRVGEAGHFVQGEQPEIYSRLVLEFVGAP